MVKVVIEPEPKVAETIAGENIAKLRLFTVELAERGEELGLIGPLEAARIWTRHILNSAILESFLTPGSLTADVGTGGGMPGLVLAIIRPDVNFYLIEPMERRCLWLNEQIEKLELKNVTVKRGRAEEFHGDTEADFVTARAVSALKKLIPMTAPLLKKGGKMVLLKGASVEAEITSAKKQIQKFKLENVGTEILGENLLAETTRVFKATVNK